MNFKKLKVLIREHESSRELEKREFFKGLLFIAQEELKLNQTKIERWF